MSTLPGDQAASYISISTQQKTSCDALMFGAETGDMEGNTQGEYSEHSKNLLWDGCSEKQPCEGFFPLSQPPRAQMFILRILQFHRAKKDAAASSGKASQQNHVMRSYILHG